MFSKLSKTLLAIAVIAGATASAQAEGLYAGGAIGTPDYRSDINGVSGGGGEDTGIGLKAYGGYQFTPNFALEGGYVDLGYNRNDGGEVKTQAVYVDGVGTLPVAPNWSLLGSVGVAQGRIRTSDGDDNSPALKLGVGVQYDLTQTTALRLGYDHYHFADAFDSKPNIGETVFGVKVAF